MVFRPVILVSLTCNPGDFLEVARINRQTRVRLLPTPLPGCIIHIPPPPSRPGLSLMARIKKAIVPSPPSRP